MNTAKLVESNKTRHTSNDAIRAEILPIKIKSSTIVLFHLCIAVHFVYIAKSNITRRLLKQRVIINVTVQLSCTVIVKEKDTPMQKNPSSF